MSEESTPEPSNEASTEAPAETTTEATPEPKAPAADALQALMAQEAASREAHEKVKHLEKYKALEGASPAELAKFAGISLQDLQKQMVDEYKPERALESQITDLQRKFQQLQQKEAEQEAKSVRDNARSLVHTYIDSSKDYPVIQKLGFQDVVFQRVLQAQEGGVKLSEAEAASKVEAELREQIQLAMGLDIFSPPKKDPEESDPAKTLSNQSSSETAAPKKKSSGNSTFDRIDDFASILRSLS